MIGARPNRMIAAGPHTIRKKTILNGHSPFQNDGGLHQPGQAGLPQSGDPLIPQ
jgi:hypothetical protein